MAKTDPVTPVAAIDASEVIEVWFTDLLASLPALRETDTYNPMRSALNDLKVQLQLAAPVPPTL